jgi:hypothetical protein
MNRRRRLFELVCLLSVLGVLFSIVVWLGGIVIINEAMIEQQKGPRPLTQYRGKP